MNLAELVSARRAEIMSEWQARVSGTLHPQALPELHLIDHLPAFLDEIRDALDALQEPEQSSIAARHGVQRLRLGFSLEGVVREYGALRDAIVAVALREAVAMSERELSVLFRSVITGISEAVSEYQRQRDAELQRHTNEHFAFIAHELRNPLGSALAAIALLERGGKLSPEERFAQVLGRALSRMQELIDSSLRATQLATGVQLVLEPITLGALLDDVELATTASAEERQIELAFRVEAEATLEADLRLLRSALTNLVRNAIKFSHEHGKVEVRARGGAERVQIEVEDSCGGLPPGAVERVFAPFAQLGADRSGFGLGLAIAKQATDAHGGAIRVQDLPGKGCIFALELPVSPRAGAARS